MRLARCTSVPASARRAARSKASLRADCRRGPGRVARPLKLNRPITGSAAAGCPAPRAEAASRRWRPRFGRGARRLRRKRIAGRRDRLELKPEKIEPEPPCCPTAAPPKRATAIPSGRPALAKPAEILIATAIQPTRIRWVVFKTILLLLDDPCGKSGRRPRNHSSNVRLSWPLGPAPARLHIPG